jgi:predicted RNA binding protein YcfA (HicA-like mRNA interferase family)
MNQQEKLRDRIRARPSQATFNDVRRLLEIEGWTIKNQRGSHVTFGKQGEFPIVVVRHDEKVKRGYLDMICQRLGLDD